MIKILIVGTGGFVGSVSRYLLGNYVHRFMGTEGFPYGTLVVNLLGCLAIGLIAGMAETKHVFDDSVKLFLLVGLLGGFTTFSTFSYDAVGMMKNTQNLQAFLYVISQVTVCLAAAWYGYYLSRLV